MRKLISVAFAVLVFNVIFFPFQKEFFGYLIIPSPATVGFFAFILSFQLFQYLAYFDSTDRVKNKTLIPLSSISVVLAFLSIFRTSGVDIGLFSVLSFVTSIISLYVFSLEKGRTIANIFEVAITPIALFFESFPSFFRGVKELKNPKGGQEVFGSLKLSRFFNGSVLNVLIGIVLGIPLVLLITSLLTSADPVFSKFVKTIFEVKNFPWWFFKGSLSRVIYSGLFSLGAIALAFLYIKNKTGDKVNDIVENINIGSERKSAFLAISVVTMISLVLGTFLVVGFKYLFANVPETELHQFGVNTLSEYVTKGFNELIIVSIIVYLTSLISVAIYRLGGKGAKYLKWFNLFLLSETVIFVISIFRRVWVYQETHGLTRVRIYGSVFLIGIIIWLLILMAKHSKVVTKWFWWELGVLVVLALTIFGVRPDYTIANKFKPTVNREIDYVYIARLSPEAIDGWVEGYKDALTKMKELEKKGRGSWTTDDERQAYYAFLTLNILRKNTKELTLKYGNKEDIIDAKTTYGRSRPFPDSKSINFTQRRAFEKIKANIGIKNLIEMEEKMYDLFYGRRKINFQNEGGSGFRYEYEDGFSESKSINTKFDRSLDSPLLQDVEIVR